MKELYCPYCGKKAEWTSNDVVYGRRFGKSFMCYYCRDCDAYVGCHQNTREPLGTMANKETRKWRMKAHAAIDPLWQSKKYQRKWVYKMLSVALEEKGEVHIGSSDIERCKKIIEIVEKKNGKIL